MKEQFVTYEIALKLKELGFNEECLAFYECSLTERIDEETGDTTGAFGWKKGEINFNISYFKNNDSSFDFSNENWLMAAAPLWQQVEQWLRDKYDLHIEIMYQDDFLLFGYKITDIKTNTELIEDTYGKYPNYLSFEEAREEAILKTIELIKN